MSFRFDKPALLMARKALTKLSSARRWVDRPIPPFMCVASRQFSLLDRYRFDVLRAAPFKESASRGKASFP